MAFPSLLHSKPSVDYLHLVQDTHWVPSDSKIEAECSLWEAKWSRVSESKEQFTIATPLYFSPSVGDTESPRPQPPGLAAFVPPPTALELQPSSPNSGYSPQTATPGSELSMEGSTTSSAYDDPFHWDTILADLPPQRSPALPVAAGAPLSIKLSMIPSVPSFAHCHATDTHSSERDSVDSYTNTTIIPTIVVLNPDAVMVPAQASVTSIIGLYDNRRESAPAATGEILTWEPQIPEDQVSEDEPEQEWDGDDADGEDSCPESEFEIVAVPALKVRLDTILEADEVDVENAFGSLMVGRPSYHSSPP